MFADLPVGVEDPSSASPRSPPRWTTSSPPRGQSPPKRSRRSAASLPSECSPWAPGWPARRAAQPQHRDHERAGAPADPLCAGPPDVEGLPHVRSAARSVLASPSSPTTGRSTSALPRLDSGARHRFVLPRDRRCHEGHAQAAAEASDLRMLDAAASRAPRLSRPRCQLAPWRSSTVHFVVRAQLAPHRVGGHPRRRRPRRHRIDMLGHGRSDKPTDPRPTQHVDELVAALAPHGLVDAVGPSRREASCSLAPHGAKTLVVRACGLLGVGDIPCSRRRARRAPPDRLR